MAALHHEPTGEERAAKVEALHRFGDFAVVDRLAEGDPTRYEAVLGLDCATVFAKLLWDQERAAYQRRLQEVLRQRQGGV